MKYYSVLQNLFAEYPPLQKLFMKDLATNLSFLYDVGGCGMLGLISADDALIFLKAMLSNSQSNFDFDFNDYPVLLSCLEEHENELLEMALKCPHIDFIQTLLEVFNADANALIDGLPLLFTVGSDSSKIEALIGAGADPFIRIDGCRFFQRPGFVCENLSIWIVDLYHRGIDLFEPSPVTKKTMFESISKPLHCTTSLSFGFFDYITPKFLTKELFIEVIKKRNEVNLFAPIDTEGNSILHYHVIKYLRFGGSFDLTSNVEQFSLFKNNAGRTPLQLLIRSQKFVQDLVGDFAILSLFKSVKGIRLLEREYDIAHGNGSFESSLLAKVGTKLFMEVLRCEADEKNVATYFVIEKKLSLSRCGVELYPFLGRSDFLLSFLLEHVLHRVDAFRKDYYDLSQLNSLFIDFQSKCLPRDLPMLFLNCRLERTTFPLV